MTPHDTTKRRRSVGRALATAVMVAMLPLAAVVAGTQTPAFGAEVVGATGKALNLEVSRGQLVRLERAAATVFVADPDVADIQVKSPRLVYLMGKQPGETTLYAVDNRERVLASMAVSVTHNLERVRRLASELHPESDVTFESIAGSVVIDGTVANPTVAEDMRRLAVQATGDEETVFNRLGVVGSTQINLRVRVAEVARGIDKQLGFNWNVIGNIGDFAFSVLTANPFSLNKVTQTLNADFEVGSWDFSAIIDALEEEGLISVLAEPNLTAMSGETASFLAGGEFPILIPEGEDRVVIEFKKFGVSLAFTPTLIGDSRINVHVRPEVSQLSSDGAISVPLAGGVLTVPALTTRRAETTVELGSGQSFAIAGLLENNITHDISKFPGLGDVPVLGGLFRSDRFQRDESELVILVTPYIVRPTPNRSLASPTDGYSPPHDLERLIVGGTHRRNPAKGQPATVGHDGRRLIGPVGFQLD